VQLSHINKIHNTIKYMNAALLEERAQNTMVHFGVAATCVPQPGSSSCMSATRDDHVVKLQINFAGNVEIAVKLCIYYCLK
jgi:mannose-1-phosphate guanylyltransferase